MQYFKIVVLLFILLFPNGCVGTDSHSKEKPTLKVRLLYTEDQCQTKRLNPHAIWIDDPDQFKKTYARLTRHTIGAQQDLSSRVDFSREGILMVTMGQKPTGGYGLELNQEFAVISDDTAVLSVSWIEPPKGAILPQIITSPCLAIIIPKGPYSKINLLDQDAHLRLQLRIDYQ
jgi:hypothetical protein